MTSPKTQVSRTRLVRRVVILLVLELVVGVVVWRRRTPNVALGRPARASSTAFGTTPAGAVDGIHYGWLGFHSNGPEEAWWTVDLGVAHRLERVVAYGRADCCFGQSVPLALEVSLDGTAYRRLATRNQAFSQFDPWEIATGGERARYVRFVTLRKTVLVLGEVEVYGRP